MLFRSGIGVTAVSVSNIGEGIDNIEKSQMGDLTKGHNFIRDNLLWESDLLYGVLETGLDIAFGVVSGMASGNLLKGFDNIRNGIKTAIEIGGNVLDGALNELINTGSIDPLGLLLDMGIGFIQGIVGNGITTGILEKLGLTECCLLTKLAETGIGALTDTTLDGILSALFGQDFDFLDALARNIYANALSAFISDPVDAATGMYLIHTTDFILASIPRACLKNKKCTKNMFTPQFL